MPDAGRASGFLVSGSRWRGLTIAAFALVLFGAHAGAQKASAYAGSDTCADCHEKESAAFATTAMGKAFLTNPETDLAKPGCEGCHGPAAKHADSGGEEMIGIVSFSRTSKTSVAIRNAICLRCHEKSSALHWHTAEARRRPCSDCHAVKQEAPK